MDCAICCETINKTTRKAVSCILCNHTACMSCTKQYLLQSVHQAHCMSCRKEWTVDILNKLIPKSFLKNEYRDMRETVLFEEEKTYLPELLKEAEREKNINSLTKDKKEIEILIKENDDNEDQFVRTQRETDRALKSKLDKIIVKRNKLISKPIKDDSPPVVIMKCPMGTCRGFLSNKYHCGLCDTQVCKDCHMKTDDEHKCNPDDVATVVELKRSTRPCPKCTTRIYKIDGCDQMFCVQCHTAFSWNTGREEHGVVHNPHYFEKLRAGGIQEIRHRQNHGWCGAMPDYRQVVNRLSLFSQKDKDMMFHLYQQVVHHRQVTMAQLVERREKRYERIKYLIGDIEEKKFKQKLFVNYQSGLRRQEEHRILDSYVTISEEIFREMAGDRISPDETYSQLLLLRELTYTAIVDLDNKYDHKGLVAPSHILHASHM